MRLLGSEASRALDAWIVAEVGLSAGVLMESAAISAAEVLQSRWPATRSVGLVCGSGNNGGDGMALARHLRTRGVEVGVYLCRGSGPLRGEAARQCEALRALGIPVEETGGAAGVPELLAHVARHEVLVDALFGTGLSRPVEGWRADVVVGLDALALPRLALDLPSGLAAELEPEPGPCLRADATVTFFGPKRSLAWSRGAELAGDIYVAELGVPPTALAGVGECLEQLSSWSDLSLPRRDVGAHKGSFGHVLVVAGSTGKSGAAALAARGALRGGAGLVTVATPAAVVAQVATGCVEAMTLPLPAEDGHRLAGEARRLLEEAWQGRSALAMGPGLGSEEDVQAWIRDVALATPLPLVLDADGVNAFAGRAEELATRAAATVLTPHPGEISRLLGIEVPRTDVDRLAAVRRAAETTGAAVVLKGDRSLVATPGGEVWVNPTGNPGMATAGSGDVLTGVMVAALGRAADPATAARTAVYLHGLAGDLGACERGEDGLIAGDVADALPRAVRCARAAQQEPRSGLARAVGRAEVRALVARTEAGRLPGEPSP